MNTTVMGYEAPDDFEIATGWSPELLDTNARPPTHCEGVPGAVEAVLMIIVAEDSSNLGGMDELAAKSATLFNQDEILRTLGVLGNANRPSDGIL